MSARTPGCVGADSLVTARTRSGLSRRRDASVRTRFFTVGADGKNPSAGKNAFTG
jgi:hypothetical protein